MQAERSPINRISIDAIEGNASAFQCQPGEVGRGYRENINVRIIECELL